jgi:hypothetical protein
MMDLLSQLISSRTEALLAGFGLGVLVTGVAGMLVISLTPMPGHKGGAQ